MSVIVCQSHQHVVRII